MGFLKKQMMKMQMHNQSDCGDWIGSDNFEDFFSFMEEFESK